MLSRRRLVEMAQRWRKTAALGRKKLPRNKDPEAHACGTLVAQKGNCVMYTCEGKRFMVPIAFLDTSILQELLKMAEEEFGLPGDCPITLPCNAVVFEHVMSQLKTRGLKCAEKELVISSAIRSCSRSSLISAGQCQQLVVF